MTTESLYVGVDGGATKTLAVVVDSTGRERGRCATGNGNYAAIGLDPAVDNIHASIAGAAIAAGAELPLASAWIGLAGVDRPADHELILPYLSPVAATVRLTNDGELVLCALDGAVGVALISGTGAISFGRDADGHSVRAGGWGHILGDEGSGYDLGCSALQAVLRATDGRGPETSLLNAILAHWGLDTPTDIIGRVYPDCDKAEIASLSTLVLAEAAGGDDVARRLITRAAGELALAAVTVAGALSFRDGKLPVAFAGGLLTRSPTFRAMVLRRIRRRVPVGQVAVVAEPALSAAQAAARSTVAGIDGAVSRS